MPSSSISFTICRCRLILIWSFLLNADLYYENILCSALPTNLYSAIQAIIGSANTFIEEKFQQIDLRLFGKQKWNGKQLKRVNKCYTSILESTARSLWMRPATQHLYHIACEYWHLVHAAETFRGYSIDLIYKVLLLAILAKNKHRFPNPNTEAICYV